MKKHLCISFIIWSLFAVSMANAAPIVNVNGVNYYSANASQTYDFIKPSNGSWDTGSNKIK